MRKKRGHGDEATEALREAIRDSGLSQNEIARRAGIDSGQVSRFVNGQRGMTLATAATVAAVLGLALRVVPKGRARKGR